MIEDPRQKEKIIELFNSGLNFTQIRCRLKIPKYKLSYRAFLSILNFKSKDEYLAANRRNKNRAKSAKRAALKDENGRSWTAVRKEILQSTNGLCFFCDQKAIDVHHLLGLKMEHDTRFLLPLCTHHHNCFSSRKYVTNLMVLGEMGQKISEKYPDLYITIRKAVRVHQQYFGNEEDDDERDRELGYLGELGNKGGFISYAAGAFHRGQFFIMAPDRFPGWEAIEKRDCSVKNFSIVVSEHGYDLEDWLPRDMVMHSHDGVKMARARLIPPDVEPDCMRGE